MNRVRYSRWICLSIVVTFITVHASVIDRGVAQPSRSTPYLDLAPQGMVTSAHPLATEAGLVMLKQGGNAIDAAVATTVAISVVEPFSAGIGGGGFLLMYQAKQQDMKALDFRERAPLKATGNMYLDAQGKVRPGASVDGHLAAATPGTIAGLYEAHRRYGRLPWKTVIAPSIQLAEFGFPVSHRFVQATKARETMLLNNAEARQIFTRNGKFYQPGDVLIQRDLANTLKLVAQNPNEFYTGKIATSIANDMRANGGLITLDDLKQYRSIWRTPVCGNFRQARVCSMPPPSSGGVHLLQILNLIGDRDLKSSGWRHPDALHFLIESMRIAYADRATYLGDPDFVKVPVNALISPAYAKLRRQGIDLKKATPSAQVKPGDPAVLQKLSRESTETSHLTVVDRDRNAVSLTFTINLGFGAGVVAKGTGIVLNNEMDDFAIAPNTPNAFGLVGGRANAIEPRKTPLSSMTPTIVTENNQLRMAVGAPGGSTIITTVLQTILNVLVYDMDARRAVSAPRIHHQWLPDELRVERFGLDTLTIAELKRRGHQIQERSSWGNANAIVVLPDGSLEGAADPRGEGVAAGF
jgi:gamma-glutamyltranspeptidase/glutathione hydrolase